MIKVVNEIKEANCITHSGNMHADDVFATAFLELYLEDINLHRTIKINEEELHENAIVYDIGRKKFDHHQEDAKKRENGIIYSSFGLLWQEFGRKFLEKRNVENIEEVFQGIDKDFVEMIDAIDNGIFPKIEAIYKVKTISDMIKLFNPSYGSNQNENEQFLKAEKIAKQILEEEILNIVGKVKANKKLEKIIELNQDKNYLLLDEFLPYEESILNNEKANNLYFAIFPSNRGGYTIKTISKSQEDRNYRMEIPIEWAGLIDEELEKVSGIKGLTFCHNNRFVLSCQSKEIAIYTVEQIIKNSQNID